MRIGDMANHNSGFEYVRISLVTLVLTTELYVAHARRQDVIVRCAVWLTAVTIVR